MKWNIKIIITIVTKIIIIMDQMIKVRLSLVLSKYGKKSFLTTFN